MAESEQDRAELSALTGVPDDTLLELVKLSGLARVSYVGPAFARIIYEAGLDTPEKLADNPPEELCEKMRAVNEKQRIMKSLHTLRGGCCLLYRNMEEAS